MINERDSKTFFPRVRESRMWELSNMLFLIKVVKIASLICNVLNIHYDDNLNKTEKIAFNT